MRSGCDQWLAAVSCSAWLGGGHDFEAMLESYTTAPELVVRAVLELPARDTGPGPGSRY